MVLVTRADLKLTKGKMAAQCGHAVSDCVLKASGIICSMIKDAGHTEIPPGTITVVGLGPGIRSDIDSITSSLPLVK